MANGEQASFVVEARAVEDARGLAMTEAVAVAAKATEEAAAVRAPPASEGGSPVHHSSLEILTASSGKRLALFIQSV